MNQMSCKYCGVVLDKDKIRWRSAWDEEGRSLPGAVYFNGDFHMPEACPVCDQQIFEEGE